MCNTFGGCGAKRSPIQQQLYLTDTFVDGIPNNQPETEAQTGKASNTELIAEILADLISYLERKENDKVGKYVVVFTKQPDGSLKPTIISTSPNMRPSDPVDNQLGQLELRKY